MLRGADRWLLPYLRQKPRRIEDVKRVFIAITDHFEPVHKTDRAGALQRMQRWLLEYPKCIEPFRDAQGRKPRHSFFYPIEQYDADVVEMLTDLCEATGSEVEVHLHHEGDTADTLREKLSRGIDNFTSHGLLSRDAAGKPLFSFIHGDWALANSHPRGICCGVKNEIAVLREMGCVADFTFPSAPDPTQPGVINQIYYAQDADAGFGITPGSVVRRGLLDTESNSTHELLMVSGVLGLNWERRKWGVLPRLENSDLTKANPPTADRWRLWVKYAPCVAGREDWLFVKLHSHGGTPWNSDMFLGDAMRSFHSFLAAQRVAFHYVTAREMLNVISAIESGVEEIFDLRALEGRFSPPPRARKP